MSINQTDLGRTFLSLRWRELRSWSTDATLMSGNAMVIAFLDVHYKGAGARAACVLCESWSSQLPSATQVQDIGTVEAYEPGNFFRRELPCILSVLRLLPSLPDVAVVDGYVWLSSVRRPGLGAYLHEALGRSTPVVGVAKSAFVGAESCSAVVRVFRGTSGNPLFVTAVGLELEAAAHHVQQMAGKHRIPEMMKITDQLSKGTLVASKRAS